MWRTMRSVLVGFLFYVALGSIGLGQNLTAQEQAELEKFLKEYSAPELDAIRPLVAAISEATKSCRAAVCVQTECTTAHTLEQQLYLLVNDLATNQSWLNRARLLFLDHYMNAEGERVSRAGLAQVLKDMFWLQKFLHEFGKLVLNATDVYGFVTNLKETATKLKGVQQAETLLWQVLKATDLLDDLSSQILGLADIAEALQNLHKLAKLAKLPVPDWPELANMPATLKQLATDIKNLAMALREARKVWNDIKARDIALEKFTGTALQIVGKLLAIISEQQIVRMQRLIADFERTVEAEAITSAAVRDEMLRIQKLINTVQLEIGHLQTAAAGVSECKKSCPYMAPIVDPAQIFDNHLLALRYYKGRIETRIGLIASTAAKFAAQPIDPTDPNAPESCRHLPSPAPDTDPLADLPRPPLDFEDPPLFPARFCSDQEKLDFDRVVLTPALERARKSWQAINHYDTELSIRIDKVKNALSKAHADEQPDTPEVYFLTGQLAKLTKARIEFAPDLKAAGEKFYAFTARLREYTEKKPEQCEQPPPFQIMTPEVPDPFCSEQERTDMIAKLQSLFDETKKQGQAWRDYRLELSTRRSVAGDAAQKASFTKQIEDSMGISDRISKAAADLQILLEKAKATAVGECLDPCLVGQWVATSAEHSMPTVNKPEGGTGFRITFKADGTQTVDYSDTIPFIFLDGLGNPRDTYDYVGTASGKISTKDGVATLQSVDSSAAKFVLDLQVIGSVQEMPIDLRVGPAGLGTTSDDNKYICTEDSLEYRGSLDVDRHATISFRLARQKQ